MDAGSVADWVAALATVGTLVAALFAARWAKQAAVATRNQADAAKTALIESRNANAIPILVELFAEHRSAEMANARTFIYRDLPQRATPAGLDDLSPQEQVLVRDLAWFYDNLGALVAHGLVDIEPVSGYLGQSVVAVWNGIEQSIVAPERAKRSTSTDPSRWQEYFENLVALVRANPPSSARRSSRNWTV